jgi:hypothetical protein
MIKKKEIKIMAMGKNEVFLHGTIVSINGNKDTGRMVLACPMITTGRDGEAGTVTNRVRTNFPALSFSRQTATRDILSDFKKGDKVDVHGHLGSYITMDDYDESNRDFKKGCYNE